MSNPHFIAVVACGFPKKARKKPLRDGRAANRRRPRLLKAIGRKEGKETLPRRPTNRRRRYVFGATSNELCREPAGLIQIAVAKQHVLVSIKF
jgi:hypothetical protein